MLSLRIFCICIVVFISACSYRPYVVEPSITQVKNNASTITVFVADHGWHTGLVIERQSIQSILPELHTRFANYKYLELGWGDAGFYQAPEITFGLALKALFWPTESVMHVVGFNSDPEFYFKNSKIVARKINKANLVSLKAFIEHSFAMAQNKKLTELGKGLYGDSQFYQANGEYHATNTCNVWTARALASAGCELAYRFKFTSSSVMNAIEDLNQQQVACQVLASH
ncbi:TIGR02117 family protein [Saccharobesus litoralis]|uniref:TIGR02117 family protein n=1 Tax=Saccharobesus litoralis TaxID=2172099 RepID=A0A2S0VME1_9ALTE|nr:TIGR02117 family protein [Saccharobesus litoralis]AWB65270.1 TIGR02117 family protein [Saccharobesus litoralis]